VKTQTSRLFTAVMLAVCLGALGTNSTRGVVGRHAVADPTSTTTPQFTSQEFLGYVKYLSSDELKGRGNGTPELDQAADYIAQHYRQFSLKPGGDGGTYLQHFMMTTGAALGPKNSLTFGSGKALTVKQEFIPFSFSESVTLQAPLVFVGYGITAPEYHYDDYTSIDAKGAIVLVLRHEPQEYDKNSVFAGKHFTTHAGIVNKAINARNHGAAAMILVNDTGNHPGKADELIRFEELSGPEQMKIAALQVKAAIVDEWLKPSGHALDELRRAIDKDLSNHSFVLDPSRQLSLTVDVDRTQKQVANVIAVLPGQDPELSKQCIVVGAHYDHLGLGGPESLAPSLTGQIHHGADDNASGTAGLLELADSLTHSGWEPAHTVVFASFAGEEAGLLGSSYYTAHPVCPMNQSIAMLNMDMIGRVSHNRLYVGGLGTSPGFPKLLQEANRKNAMGPFELTTSASGYGPSDHTCFTAREVPVLFFFSGLHSDYHRPSDTWDKIDAPDGARVVSLVAEVTESLDQLKRKPQYVRVGQPPTPAGGGPGGYGPYFGSVPDFGQEHGGVKFADVHDGSPAGRAGFKGGDVMVEFDHKKIDNLYDFTYALRAHKPGDTVMVTVVRGREKITRQVTLEVRK
jgi:hypothetical protein